MPNRGSGATNGAAPDLASVVCGSGGGLRLGDRAAQRTWFWSPAQAEPRRIRGIPPPVSSWSHSTGGELRETGPTNVRTSGDDRSRAVERYGGSLVGSTTRRSAAVVCFVALLLSVLPLRAAVASDPPAAANPNLAASCGLDITIVLDRSGSIGNDNDEVQDAAQAFNDALMSRGLAAAWAERRCRQNPSAATDPGPRRRAHGRGPRGRPEA